MSTISTIFKIFIFLLNILYSFSCKSYIVNRYNLYENSDYTTSYMDCIYHFRTKNIYIYTNTDSKYSDKMKIFCCPTRK